MTDWDAGRYEDDHAFVSAYGADLLSLLDPEPDERALDVGCGTGHLTAELDETAGKAVGIDRSAAMLREARAEHPDVSFVRADARSFAFAEPFDAALSNAALHWIPEADHGDALASVFDALRPGGRFVAELGGTGNVETIERALRAELEARGHSVESPWYFPSVGAYAPRLENAGFEVRLMRLFERPTEVESIESWLRMFGEPFFAGVGETEMAAVIEGVRERTREALYDDGEWHADYRRLRFVAVKPE